MSIKPGVFYLTKLINSDTEILTPTKLYKKNINAYKILFKLHLHTHQKNHIIFLEELFLYLMCHC